MIASPLVIISLSKPLAVTRSNRGRPNHAQIVNVDRNNFDYLELHLAPQPPLECIS